MSSRSTLFLYSLYQIFQLIAIYYFSYFAVQNFTVRSFHSWTLWLHKIAYFPSLTTTSRSENLPTLLLGKSVLKNKNNFSPKWRKVKRVIEWCTLYNSLFFLFCCQRSRSLARRSAATASYFPSTLFLWSSLMIVERLTPKYFAICVLFAPMPRNSSITRLSLNVRNLNVLFFFSSTFPTFLLKTHFMPSIFLLLLS